MQVGSFEETDFRDREESVMKSRNFLSALVLTFALVGLAPGASSGVFFDWVCDEATCGGTTSSFTFSFDIEFADSVVTPSGSFTGVDGPPANVLSATFTTDLGSGFTLSLDDLIAGSSASFDNDREDFYVAFNSTATEVKDLLDDGSGSVLVFNGDSDFFGGTGNLLYIIEGTDQSYYISYIQKATGVSSSTPIRGKLVRRSGGVPEPSTFAVFGLGLVGLGFAKRHRNKK